MANATDVYAMLGNVLSNAGAQYAANRREDQIRQQHLQDIADARAFAQQEKREERAYQERQTREARGFEERFRREGWARDERLYNERANDDIIRQLLAASLITPKEAREKDEVAIAKALKDSSPETQRNREEIAKFVATIPELRKGAKGNQELITKLNRAYDLTPNQIGELREIRKDANDMIAQVLVEDADNAARNKENAAILFNQYDSELTGIRNQLRTNSEEASRIEKGQFNADELARFDIAARASIGPEFKKKPGSQETKDELNRLVAEAKENYKTTIPYRMLQANKDLTTQMATLAELQNSVLRRAEKGFLSGAEIRTAAEGLRKPAATGTGMSLEEAKRKILEQKKNAAGAAGGPVAGRPAAETLRFPTATAAPMAPGTQALAALDQAAPPTGLEGLAAPVAPVERWSPPVVNPAGEMIERNPVTGGVVVTAADVERRRNSDALGNAMGRFFADPIGGAPVDASTGKVATPGQQAVGFGLSRTATDSIWDRIRNLAGDPRGPLRIDLLKEGMMLAKARGETIPDDIAAEFSIPSGRIPTWTTIAEPSEFAGAAQRFVPLGNIGSAPRAFGAEPTTSLAPAPVLSELAARAREDDVLTRSPWSPQSIMIREQRGLPLPTATPRPVTFGLY